MNPGVHPVSSRQRIIGLFTPDAKARNFLMAAILIPMLLFACITAIILSVGPSHTEMSNLDAFLFILGLFLLPLAAVLMALSALREPHYPLRAILWLAATIFISAAGMLVFTMMLFDKQLDHTAALTFLLVIVAPIALFFSLPALYSIARAIPEVRAALNSAASDRVLAFILARGALSLDNLSTAAGIPPGEADNIVDELLHSGRLAGTLDAHYGWVYSASYLAEQQRQLLGWINLRGHIRIDELANLLKTTPTTTVDWIYQLVQRGQLGGYVNWKSRIIHAATAKKIGINSQCPECGGSLAPGTGQRIICLHCGSEIWATRNQEPSTNVLR